MRFSIASWANKANCLCGASGRKPSIAKADKRIGALNWLKPENETNNMKRWSSRENEEWEKTMNERGFRNSDFYYVHVTTSTDRRLNVRARARSFVAWYLRAGVLTVTALNSRLMSGYNKRRTIFFSFFFFCSTLIHSSAFLVPSHSLQLVVIKTTISFNEIIRRRRRQPTNSIEMTCATETKWKQAK